MEFVIIENEAGERYAVRPFDFYHQYKAEGFAIVSWQNGEAYVEKREHHHDYHQDEPAAPATEKEG